MIARRGRLATTAASAASALLLLATPASGESGLPRSVVVERPGAYVQTSPSPRGSRRGTLALGARLAPLEGRDAAGCAASWYRIGAEAWVCGTSVAPSSLEPAAAQLPVVEEGSLVPAAYGFAGPDGARVYRTLEDGGADDRDRELDPRSGLHISEAAVHEGGRYRRLVAGGWVPASDIVPARPSAFSGERLGAGDPPRAWVGRRRAAIRSAPGRGRTLGRLGPRSIVPVFESRTVGRALWVRIAEAGWLRSTELHLPRPPAPPPGIDEDERWIDIDTTSQILTAYEGSRAVFTTLVSTGRSGTSTPAGTYRVWAKLATGDMAGEGGGTVDERPYLMQGVPWVLYFNEGVALHGAYWHDRFGERRSHGCVNLAPRDARWVFEWARPALPPGWIGVLPTRSEPGTIVVVR